MLAWSGSSWQCGTSPASARQSKTSFVSVGFPPSMNLARTSHCVTPRKRLLCASDATLVKVARSPCAPGERCRCPVRPCDGAQHRPFGAAPTNVVDVDSPALGSPRRCRPRPVLRQWSHMEQSPTPVDLNSLAARYGVTAAVLEDLYARRRAGARDPELINLLGQPDRGGLATERAREVLAALPNQ